ncbi:hypothetical protein QFZ23_003730 [Arthrobacter globiformis]|uniref:hypothetical protein n=1 Tax=Arthrobacter globiformis TaxID=1665 RepID=UPI0027899F98|nr:hypothetical protein [Arthrobacter globiformis]MDQ1059829.1 hypothetical protein [Arthrobacter globiformis]
MTVSKWVAAGSSAAVFAGGLFIGAPTAAAAPGDAACLQAFTQFEGALSAAGITEATVADVESKAAVTADAEAVYLAMVEAAGAVPAAELATAQAALDDAIAATAAAEEAEEEAEDSGDPAAISAAEDATEAAEEAEDAARQAVTDLTAAYEAAINTPEIVEARDAFNAAAAEFETLLAAVSLDEATATNLMGLFEAYVTACNPGAVGVDPVATPPVTAPGGITTSPVTAPESTTPAVANAVNVAPAKAGTAAAVTNKGLNVQTAAEAEPGVHPGLALLAGLLAAGIAVPAAVAVRMRRLERSRN